MKKQNNIHRKYNKTRLKKARKHFCWVPFKNMYIENTGNVLSCCYNRNFVFGHYPDRSLRDIWWGNERNNMTEAIGKKQDPGGCHLCFNELQKENYRNIHAREYDSLGQSGGMPSKLELEISNECNLRCIMCSEKFSSQFHPKHRNSQIHTDNFVAEIKEFIPHLQWINFSGGEPFLIDIYYDIWKAASDINPGCKLFVQSNGTIFNAEIERIIKTGNFHISLSVDSLDKDHYEAIRLNAHYEQVLEHIHAFNRLMRKKNRYLNITACPMTMNRYDLPKLFSFCNSAKIQLLFHNFISPAKYALSSLSVKELNNTRLRLAEALTEECTHMVHLHNKKQLENLIRNIDTIIQHKKSKNDGQ